MMERMIITDTDIANLNLDAFGGRSQFFFDTNILLYLHGPYAGFRPDPRTRIYSRLMRVIRDNGGRVVVNPIVIAEFINRYIQDLYRDLKRRGMAGDIYKEFRESSSYDEIAAEAGAAIVGFCRRAHIVGTEVSQEDLETYCAALRQTTIDFNDLIMLETCRRCSLVLVTHDRDFDSADVPLITANQGFSR